MLDLELESPAPTQQWNALKVQLVEADGVWYTVGRVIPKNEPIPRGTVWIEPGGTMWVGAKRLFDIEPEARAQLQERIDAAKPQAWGGVLRALAAEIAAGNETALKTLMNAMAWADTGRYYTPHAEQEAIAAEAFADAQTRRDKQDAEITRKLELREREIRAKEFELELRSLWRR